MNNNKLKALRDLSASLEGETWIIIPPHTDGNLCVIIERFDGPEKLSFQQEISAEALEAVAVDLGEYLVERANRQFRKALRRAENIDSEHCSHYLPVSRESE